MRIGVKINVVTSVFRYNAYPLSTQAVLKSLFWRFWLFLGHFLNNIVITPFDENAIKGYSKCSLDNFKSIDMCCRHVCHLGQKLCEVKFKVYEGKT